jgi:hypothetical protein
MKRLSEDELRRVLLGNSTEAERDEAIEFLKGIDPRVVVDEIARRAPSGRIVCAWQESDKDWAHAFPERAKARALRRLQIEAHQLAASEAGQPSLGFTVEQRAASGEGDGVAGGDDGPEDVAGV